MIISSLANIAIDNANSVRLNDILENMVLSPEVSGENVYVISMNEINETNIGELENALMAKHLGVLCILAYGTRGQEERARVILDKRIRNVIGVELSQNLTEEIMKNRLRKIVNEFIMNSKSLVEEIDETRAVVSVGEAALPFKYVPGSILIDVGESLAEAMNTDTIDLITKSDVVSSEAKVEFSEAPTSRFEEEGKAMLEEIEHTFSNGMTDKDYYNKFKNSVEVMDLDSLREAININEIIRSLQLENSEYLSLRKTIDIINEEINSVILDGTIHSEEKLRKIIGLIRSKQDRRGAKEQLEVSKFIDVLSILSKAIEDSFTEIIRKTEDKYATKQLRDMYYENRDEVAKIVEERFQEQLKLNELLLSLNKTLNIIDKAKEDYLKSIAVPDMTKSEIINNMLEVTSYNGIADNANELVNTIINAVNDSQINFSNVAERLTKVMDSVFRLSKLDNEIAERKNYLNKLLTANQIEESVIITNPIKMSTRVWVGANNTGKTVTAWIASKLNSRQHNTVIMDLTGDNKLSLYTETVDFNAIDVKDFPKQDLLSISTDNSIVSRVKVVEMVEALTSYYKTINIIIGTNDDLFEVLKDMALTVNIVVDDSTASINTMKTLTDGLVLENTAIKVYDMDTSLNPMEITELYGLDPLAVKVIKVPKVPSIRKATINKIDPLTYEDVRLVLGGIL